MKKIILTVMIVTLAITLGCSRDQPGQLPEPVSVFKPLASVREIMLSIVDPNVDAIWNSVSTISTAEGVEEKKPQTDEDWQKLHQHAVTLREVYNLLAVKGRKVAEPGAVTSSGGAELHAEQIEKLINAEWDDFLRHAEQLQLASDQVLKAIDDKNVEALEEAGAHVEHACEACHSKFWYPGDVRPSK